jgi:serine/threonine protein kinase
MASEDPLIGHRVGRYTIKSLLGQEELGKVYAALDVGSRPVRMKVLDPALSENTEVMGRFGREMLATATINHPNTVQMLDFGEHKGLFHFIVLEYLEYHTLADELKAKGKLPFDRVAHIGAQVASALSSAHGENIIHRNLSPANILLLDNAIDGDYAKVRDFGLSILQTDNSDASGLTAVGKRVGTIAYMAPEYIQLAQVDPRGDLYALGCVMFEALCGRTPFVGRTSEIMEGHVTGVPAVPSAYAQGVPEWMDDLILRMLAKNPDNRPLSAFDVLSALKTGTGKALKPPALRPLSGLPVTAVPPPPSEAPTEEAPATVTAGRVAIVLVLGVVAAGVAASMIVGLILMFAGP